MPPIPRRSFGKPLAWLVRVLICVSASVAALIDATGATFAQASFPDRPIRLIVAFSPGGASDMIARHIAVELKDTLGWTVVVENRPGDHGQSAAAHLAGSEPDGRTLMIADNELAIGQGLYRPPGFDPVRQFDAICLVATAPLVLSVSPKLGAGSIAQFVARTQTVPGKLRFSSSRIGDLAHLAFEVFAAGAGIDAVHVPHKGSGQPIGDITMGSVDATMAAVVVARKAIAQGQVKGLAVTGPDRSPLLPDIPTLRESGIVTGDADLRYWWGIFGPHGMPQDIKARLDTALAAALARPALRIRFARLDVDPDYAPAPALKAKLANEIANWAKFIETRGLKAE
jgi:tripartite-type tricarboxylate transporter receptor subunit TctC